MEEEAHEYKEAGEERNVGYWVLLGRTVHIEDHEECDNQAEEDEDHAGYLEAEGCVERARVVWEEYEY